MIKICFRVDANHSVGMGHLMESISLADSLRKMANCNIVFLMKRFQPATNILREKGYHVEFLEEDFDEEDEINIVSRLGKKWGSEVLIIDLLNKKDGYFQKLRTHIKTLVVILDAAEQRPVSADIVVNFNIVQDEEFYEKLPDSGTTYCIGPKYMLLPDGSHTEWLKDKIIPETCRTIFLNQGGSDPFGLTAKIIKALELLHLRQKIFVVVGHAVSHEHKGELQWLRPRLKNDYQFEWGITQEQMYQLMSESDMAITAAGNTLYELAVFGVPVITVCHHEKHNLVAQKFAEKNAVINLGVGASLEIHTISEVVNKLLRSKEKRVELSANIKKIVDGLGSERAAKKVLEI